MTTVESTLAAESPENRAGGALWRRIEGWLERVGDRLNPILVKECRQALKSKQFTITFALLLICGWLWSIAGVAMIGPGVYYGSEGPSMFYGYFIVLAFPLLVVVPYGAFRSLAGEREDRTFELLQITTLSPRQVVAGKLGSAALQVVVYLSALAPCLVFTYLLRGIDLLTIGFMLGYTVMASLGLSVFVLLLATVTRERHWSVVISVVVILGEFYLFAGAIFLSQEMLSHNVLQFDRQEFWIANLGILSAYLCYFALFFMTAAAQLTFPSDNRSTRLRIVMVAHQVVFTGWIGWGWAQSQFPRDYEMFPLMLVMLTGLHWYAMGVFLVGESPQLSLRVQRALPQSTLGRTLFTVFNPGPATGFLLAVGSVLSAIVLASLARWVFPRTAVLGAMWGRPVDLALFMGAGFCYFVIFLGLGLLLVRMARSVWQVNMASAVLVQGLLVIAAGMIPWVISSLGSDPSQRGWTFLQLTNVTWTMGEILGGRMLSNGPLLLTLLSTGAFLVLVANLRAIIAEVSFVRVAKPFRVVDEEKALAPPPPSPGPQNPWDEP